MSSIITNPVLSVTAFEGTSLERTLSTPIDASQPDALAVAVADCLKQAKAIEEAAGVVVPFGTKFRNMNLSQIVSKRGGMNYLLFLSQWDHCRQDMKEAIEVINSEFERQQSASLVHKDCTRDDSGS